jgi:L-ribulose-5-phosphate 4-epimerase
MGRVAEALREEVYRANMDLARSGLVMGTFGNVSGVDRAAGLLAIKPSGVPYEDLRPEHIVPVALSTGEVVDSDRRPSSDTPTHLELYRLSAAASCTRIPCTPRPWRRRACRSAASARRTPTIFVATCP